MDNMHPADELAWLREEIRRLSCREAELRARFIAGCAPRHGTEASVTVRATRRAVFRRERLPAELLSDPRFWDTRLSHAVTVAMRKGGAPVPAPEPDDAFALVGAR